MRPNQMKEIILNAFAARALGDIINPLFVSPPGLGKTEINRAIAKELGVDSITITAALMETPDMRGYPMLKVIDGVERMVTAVPIMWPTEGKGILFLEEVNRGSVSISNCIMGLTDARRGFDNYTLPEGWIVVGLINPDDGKNDVSVMDPALADRFTAFEVTYDQDTFLEYMKASKWHKDIVLFIEAKMWQYCIPTEVKNVPGSLYISPRTWSKVNSVLKAGIFKESELMFYSAILGANIGRDFYNFKYNESPVFQYDLVKNLKNSIEKLTKFSDPANFKAGMIGITCKDILEHNNIEDSLLIEVLKVIPAEQSRTLLRDLEYKREDKDLFKRIIASSKEIKEIFKSLKKEVKNVESTN